MVEKRIIQVKEADSSLTTVHYETSADNVLLDSISGLSATNIQEALAEIVPQLGGSGSTTLNMPQIRLGTVSDANGTMIISRTNPLIFSIHITDGKLQVGDQVQVCTRQLYTYKRRAKRKYKLRSQWETIITEENVNNDIIFVNIEESPTTPSQQLFTTGNVTTSGTFSMLYIRVRRPIWKNGKHVDGQFSNVIPVFKKHILKLGKVFIK